MYIVPYLTLQHLCIHLIDIIQQEPFTRFLILYPFRQQDVYFMFLTLFIGTPR